MTDNPPMAAEKPDVQIRQYIRNSASRENEQIVMNEASCRFGCRTKIGPDIREIIKYADDHEKEIGHILAKYERIAQAKEDVVGKMLQNVATKKNIVASPQGIPHKHDAPPINVAEHGDKYKCYCGTEFVFVVGKGWVE